MREREKRRPEGSQIQHQPPSLPHLLFLKVCFFRAKGGGGKNKEKQCVKEKREREGGKERERGESAEEEKAKQDRRKRSTEKEGEENGKVINIFEVLVLFILNPIYVVCKC